MLKGETTASHAEINNAAIADWSQVVCDRVDSLKDNKERKLNVIVFGVVESASSLRNKRNEDDTNVFIETCQNEVRTNMSSNDTSKITHLGRKKEDGTPRPILVSMSSQDVKKIL